MDDMISGCVRTERRAWSKYIIQIMPAMTKLHQHKNISIIRLSYTREEVSVNLECKTIVNIRAHFDVVRIVKSQTSK